MMLKRKCSEYFGTLLVIISIPLIINQSILGFVLFAAWYFLYGFVGLAHLLSRSNKHATLFFLLMTCPYILVPFRKSFYYWIKSQNLLQRKPEKIQAAFTLAQKVKVDSLYTDNNKAIFYSYLAALHFDLGHAEEAKTYLCLSDSLSHHSSLDAVLANLRNTIDSNANSADNMEETP